MVTRINRDKLFYAFKPDLEPVARVAPGEEVIFETYDCFQGQIRTPKDLVAALDWDRTNPGTGPIYIEGARPGKVIRIDILDIMVEKDSVMVTIPGEGALGDKITEIETTILHQTGDTLVFKDRVRIPVSPMIGVIGIAPAEGSVGNGVPGYHGGNMDCKLVSKGSRLYLTSQVDGGLLGLGDLHAVMGDGEIVVVGAEVSGSVRLKVDLVDMPNLPTPFLENDDLVAAIYSDPDLDKAVDGAIHNMSDFLTGFAGLSVNDAGMLMSACGSLNICQVVDPAKTARFEFPKSILAQLGYRIPA